MFFFFNDTATTEIYTLSLHDALPIFFQLFFIIPLLLSCEGKTPEDFDREFNEKYNACVDRAKLRCDSDMNTEACELMANERCQSFLGTSDNPIVK